MSSNSKAGSVECVLDVEVIARSRPSAGELLSVAVRSLKHRFCDLQELQKKDGTDPPITSAKNASRCRWLRSLDNQGY